MTRVPDDPDALLDLAERLGRSAADLVSSARRSGPVRFETKSTVTDMVTEYDHASEVVIVDGLHEARPDDGIVGEEGADTAGTSGITWLIDPIDGTTNYLYGLPGYCVSIGAHDDDGPLLGVVVLPATGEVYRARRGGGAWCNGEPVRCSDITDLSRALVGTGFSYQPALRLRQAARIARLIDRIRDIRRFGAAAADLSYTAAGRLDAYYEEHLNPWDLAAGAVIAAEAGCRLGSIDGGEIRPSSTLVAAPGIFEALAQLLIEAEPDDAAADPRPVNP